MSKNHDVSDFVLLGLVLGLITDIGQCAFSNITYKTGSNGLERSELGTQCKNQVK